MIIFVSFVWLVVVCDLRLQHALISGEISIYFV